MSALCLQNIALPARAKYLQQLLMRIILLEVVTGGQLESKIVQLYPPQPLFPCDYQNIRH